MSSRCSRSGIRMTGKFGEENNMIPAPVHPEPSGLSMVEKLLVDRLVPMMRVTLLKKGEVV